MNKLKSVIATTVIIAGCNVGQAPDEHRRIEEYAIYAGFFLHEDVGTQ